MSFWQFCSHNFNNCNEKLDIEDAKDLCIIILYEMKQKEEQDVINFLKSNIIPIYTKEIKEENGTYFYNKIFKFKNIIQNE